MPDNDDAGGGDQKVEISVEDLRNLRAIAKTHQEDSAKLAVLERENAFAKAKLDLDDPKMGYFIKGYEGDLEPEKIREAAVQAGFVAQQQQIPPAEMAGHQQMGAAAAGGEAGPPFDLGKAIADAQSPEEVMRLMTEKGHATIWNRPS